MTLGDTSLNSSCSKYKNSNDYLSKVTNIPILRRNVFIFLVRLAFSNNNLQVVIVQWVFKLSYWVKFVKFQYKNSNRFSHRTTQDTLWWIILCFSFLSTNVSLRLRGPCYNLCSWGLSQGRTSRMTEIDTGSGNLATSGWQCWLVTQISLTWNVLLSGWDKAVFKVLCLQCSCPHFYRKPGIHILTSKFYLGSFAISFISTILYLHIVLLIQRSIFGQHCTHGY